MCDWIYDFEQVRVAASLSPYQVWSRNDGFIKIKKADKSDNLKVRGITIDVDEVKIVVKAFKNPNNKN